MREARFEFYQPTPLLRELGILAFLADDPNSSQKRIAERVGLGAAMVHSYLHTLQEQGLVEFRGSSSKKLQYLLTSEGKRQLESLASKHLAEVNRLIQEIQSSVVRAVERATKDGVRCLAVLADPAVRQLIDGMDQDLGVRLVFPRMDISDSTKFLESMGAMPDALLVAVVSPEPALREMIERFRVEGLRTYRAI